VRRFLAGALLLAATLHGQAIRSNAGFKTNQVPRNDDGSSNLTPLGFSANFFGRTRTHAYVNNNGNITFDAALSTYTPFGLVGTQREIIAAFFADVDTRDPASQLVTYGTDTIDGHQAFGANYINVGYYSTHSDKLNSFQLILIDRKETGEGNFDIEFNYQRVGWETGDASGGVNGFGGVPASVGWSNGSGEAGTSFELEGSLQPGAFLDGARRSLIRNRLNSTVPGRYIFRARGGRVLPPLTITTGCPLPPAFIGAPYAQQFEAVGGLSYRWSMLADPGATSAAGMNLSTAGNYSGTPTATGTTEFTVQVIATTEDGEETTFKRCSLSVQPPSVAITSACPLPAGTVGQSYSSTLQANGGRPPYTWSLNDGSSVLPAGLSLSTAGSISGVPREPGTTIITLRANSNPGDGAEPAMKTCSITVKPAVLELTTGCSLPPATAGVPYSQTLTVSGGVAPYTWSSNSQLPPGLSLSPEGVVSGAPTSWGGPFQVRVRDARGTAYDQTCTLAVNQPFINIATACPLPPATTGQPYSQQIAATGGTAPYSWSVLGALPSGLSLTGDGRLSGNAGSAGPLSFRFLVTDSTGASATKGCNLIVERSGFSLTTCPLPNGSIGLDYQQLLRVDGGTPPYVFSAVSGMPAGLSLNTNGLLTGRPRETGSGTVTLRVMDGRGQVATQPCGLAIAPSPLVITGTCPLPQARVGAPYLQRFTASGGVAPYRFRLDGALPPGLELSSDGTVRGTPVAAAQTNFEIEAIDAHGWSVPKSCSLQSSLPDLPTFRLSSISSTVLPASNGPVAKLELSHAYSLPVQGEFVLSTEPDTGSFEPAINRADPRVRFSNGEQRLRFTIPAGTLEATAPVVSTGTVAGLITIRAMNLSTGGQQILTPPTPKQFRVPRAIPVITDVCLATSTSAAELRITGYSTTRQLDRAEFSYTAGTQQQTASIDVSGSAAEYFGSDLSVRNGGAFTVSVPLTLEGSGTLQPNTITLSNSVGTTATKTVAVCR
jgi:hypothetical protein